ncbi:Asparagine synthetase domain-containing protein 1, partial [Araneus ventricosus]
MKNPLNNFPAHTEKEKAEIIANHFETQFKLNNFGTASTENTVSKSIEKFFTRSPTPTYEKVKASKIADYLKKIKKAPGIDNIANKMLKNLPLKIILKLANLYNYMFKLNHFPGCWKTARILPILKPGKDPTQPISYRPISLLLTLSKLSKKIILNRYIKHANKVRIPIPQQFGFTPQLSTTHQLLRVTEHILEGKSANLATATIFLDIAKAFDKVKECQSDSKFLSEKLFTCTESSDVLSIIESIKGPFAFVFYQSNGLLWFGRDVFGRRSLLWRADPSAFCLCSVSDAASEWKEVSARGVYCLDLKQTSLNKSFIIYLYPWSSTPSGSCLFQSLDEEVSAHVILTVKSEKSIKNPIFNILNKSFPSDELLEVFKFPEESYKSKDRNADFFKHFLEISEISGPLLAFEEVLSNAVRKRVQNHQHICKKCFTPVEGTQQDWTCGHASVGVLFSGGLDSIVIACLADRHLKDREPIDLLNVAFASNMNLRKSTAADRHSVYETPDRVTGRNGVMALRKICPNRTWNFVEVNITEEDLINERRDTISHLLRPSCTVLDDSIGCALWFASHGKGILTSDKGCESYSSPVRVLLVGMGADEQLGGYSRHRAKFNSFGWPGLIEELTLELDRISSRNLGRDD